MKKKGMAIEEIIKLLIVIFVLVIMIGVIILLLKGKGFGEGGILDSIKNFLRFGRAG